MCDFEKENEETQEQTYNIEDNYNQDNQYQIYTKPNCKNIENQKIELNESKISEESSKENEKLFIDTESNKSIKQNIPERGILINVNEINENFHINKLKKKYVNKKDHKQNKKKAYNQYKSPNNQYNININNFSPFQMNQMNIQGQNYNSNNYMNNNFMQNNQNMNNNNQMRFNNYGMNNNMNMNNFNQNIPPQQNMASMQQMLYSMQNMNLNGNINNQNRYNMNMMNNMNNSNNMQNQNQNFRINDINLPYSDLDGIDNSNNQKEIKKTIITREKTVNGQKVTKVEYKIKLVNNDKKKMK